MTDAGVGSASNNFGTPVSRRFRILSGLLAVARDGWRGNVPPRERPLVFGEARVPIGRWQHIVDPDERRMVSEGGVIMAEGRSLLSAK